MLNETFHHQIGCKKFHKRLHCLTVLFLIFGTLTIATGVAETVLWNEINNLKEGCEDSEIFACRRISPSLIFGIISFLPPILSFFVVNGYTERVRLSLIVFLGLALVSVVSALAMTVISVGTIARLPLLEVECNRQRVPPLPLTELKSVFQRRIDPLELEIEHDVNSSLLNSCTESGVFFHMKLIIVFQMIVGVFQLVIALVGTVIVTQVRPWKKFKVRIRTTYDRFRSIKLSCGCGTDKPIKDEHNFNFSVSRVNYGFRDFGENLEKVTSIDDDKFLSHLESCAPSRFSTPRHSPRQVRQNEKSTDANVFATF